MLGMYTTFRVEIVFEQDRRTRRSASVRTEVKEVVTLLGNSKTCGEAG